MMSKKRSAEKTVRDIRRATRRKYSAEEKIRIVIEGLRGEDSIAELCRREGINTNVYYRWSKEFMEAEQLMENRLLKKSVIADGEDDT
jgi:transposase